MATTTTARRDKNDAQSNPSNAEVPLNQGVGITAFGTGGWEGRQGRGTTCWRRAAARCCIGSGHIHLHQPDGQTARQTAGGGRGGQGPGGTSACSFSRAGSSTSRRRSERGEGMGEPALALLLVERVARLFRRSRGGSEGRSRWPERRRAGRETPPWPLISLEVEHKYKRVLSRGRGGGGYRRGSPH